MKMTDVRQFGHGTLKQYGDSSAYGVTASARSSTYVQLQRSQ
jgi:hypothetical protein